MTTLRRPAAPLAWLAALTLAAPVPALACGFCYSLGGNPLALPHPRAIEIAVATRTAIDNGKLDERPLVPARLAHGDGTGHVALHKIPAPVLVERWAAQLLRPEANAPPLSVHFLFIDTEQSCALILRGGRVLFEVRSAAGSDARVVTTRPAFHALLIGKLTPGEAQRLGLLHFEGERRAWRVIPAIAGS
jgi:hypothetical protein